MYFHIRGSSNMRSMRYRSPPVEFMAARTGSRLARRNNSAKNSCSNRGMRSSEPLRSASYWWSTQRCSRS